MLAESDSAADNLTLYGVKEIQQMFNCGRKKAYELMNELGFPSFKTGNRLYVEKAALEKWIKKQMLNKQ